MKVGSSLPSPILTDVRLQRLYRKGLSLLFYYKNFFYKRTFSKRSLNFSFPLYKNFITKNFTNTLLDVILMDHLLCIIVTYKTQEFLDSLFLETPPRCVRGSDRS